MAIPMRSFAPTGIKTDGAPLKVPERGFFLKKCFSTISNRGKRIKIINTK